MWFRASQRVAGRSYVFSQHLPNPSCAGIPGIATSSVILEWHYEIP